MNDAIILCISFPPTVWNKLANVAHIVDIASFSPVPILNKLDNDPDILSLLLSRYVAIPPVTASPIDAPILMIDAETTPNACASDSTYPEAAAVTSLSVKISCNELPMESMLFLMFINCPETLSPSHVRMKFIFEIFFKLSHDSLILFNCSSHLLAACSIIEDCVSIASVFIPPTPLPPLPPLPPPPLVAELLGELSIFKLSKLDMDFSAVFSAFLFASLAFSTASA